MSAFDRLRVAKNCPASWNRMKGDDKVRHCTHCDRKVYNFTNMTRAEAISVVAANGGHLCARFYLRHDGKIMTKDCGNTIRVRAKVCTWLTSAAALIGLTWAVGTPVYAGQAASPESEMRYESLTLDYLNSEIINSRDAAGKAELVQMRNTAVQRLQEAVKRYLKRKKR